MRRRIGISYPTTQHFGNFGQPPPPNTHSNPHTHTHISRKQTGIVKPPRKYSHKTDTGSVTKMIPFSEKYKFYFCLQKFCLPASSTLIFFQNVLFSTYYLSIVIGKYQNLIIDMHQWRSIFLSKVINITAILCFGLVLTSKM